MTDDSIAPEGEALPEPEAGALELADEGNRVFQRGDLKYFVLKLLADGAHHGYQLLKQMEDELGGGYRPSPGAIYPTLSALEEAGYVTAEDDDDRRVYHITDNGIEALREKSERIDAVVERAERIAQRRRGPGRSLLPELEEDLSDLKRTVLRRARLLDIDLEALKRIRRILESARTEVLNTLDELGLASLTDVEPARGRPRKPGGPRRRR